MGPALHSWDNPFKKGNWMIEPLTSEYLVFPCLLLVKKFRPVVFRIDYVFYLICTVSRVNLPAQYCYRLICTLGMVSSASEFLKRSQVKYFLQIMFLRLSVWNRAKFFLGKNNIKFFAIPEIFIKPRSVPWWFLSRDPVINASLPFVQQKLYGVLFLRCCFAE
jgi:hypothetical protein